MHSHKQMSKSSGNSASSRPAAGSSRREFLQRACAATSCTSAWAATGVLRPAVAQTQVDSDTVARGARAAVATVSPLASRAAMQAFDRGGNAVDAAIAASLMLSVVDGHNSGIGGGCLAVVRTADGNVFALDGREMAPAAATPAMFYTDGKPDPSKSQVGTLAAGVPGLLAALAHLGDRYGKLEMEAALLGAAEVAEQGFVIPGSYARRLQGAATHLRKFPSSAEILLDSKGQPWQAGDTLRQQDLAGTLRNIAEQGHGWFYEGGFADKTATFMASAGGMLTKKDFADYKTVRRSPVEAEYRGSQVLGCPPPSSGGIHNAQMLGMLADFDVAKIYADSEANFRHLLVEVMKRAMADRAYWLGDADFTNVPRGLLDKDYLRSRGSTIDLEKAITVASHGQPPRADVDLFGAGGHTTHLTTADAEGNVVALTQTVNTTFGCKVIVPGTGVVLNNELDDFSIAPGVRNAFGLVGSEANLIAPGKRPLSSMSPTIVMRDGQPVMTCGAAGGPKIITSVLQILVRVLDLGESIGDAVAAPRTHHQWSPDVLVCEKKVSHGVADALQAKGHRLERISTAAVAQGLQISDRGITAASDPRVESSAIAI